MTRRLLRLLRPPRKFPPTRGGWWFLVATLAVGAAAINGGVNLLFLIWGMMLSLIIASGILSEMCIRHLDVTRSVPPRVFAGAPYLMGITLRNRKKRIPSFSVEVEDLVAEKPVEKRCFFLKLPAGRQQQTAYRHTVPRRGPYELSGIRISTKFPFGLIRKSKDIEAPANFLVYPALVSVPAAALPSFWRRGQNDAPRRGHGGDFHGLREFRPGDDPRDIHWRTSVRRGRPFIRENEDESGRTVIVILDAPPETASTAVSPFGDTADPFEAAVSWAASLAVDLLARGYQVGLLLGAERIPPAAGGGQEDRLLRRLALVSPSELIGGGPAAAAFGAGIARLRVRPSLRGTPDLIWERGNETFGVEGRPSVVEAARPSPLSPATTAKTP